MKPLPEPVLEAIEDLLAVHGSLASRDLAAKLGVTRQMAHRRLQAAIRVGLLERGGRGRAVRYRRATPASIRLCRDLEGLEEDLLWRALVERVDFPETLSEELHAGLHYCAIELLNNAIEHSGGSMVELRLEPGREELLLEVEDDGIGAFRNVRERLGLASEIEALQDLSKGKTTTDPQRHTGEGLFFVSKVARQFELHSGELAWRVDNEREDHAFESRDPRRGTLACVGFDPASQRPIEEVFREYTEDYEFSRNRTIVKLFEMGTRFVSRSEARRLVHGLDRFREVILDFRGVRGVGQAFVDEVFRVWARTHPEVGLRPVNMVAAVDFMVRRGLRRAEAPD